MQRAEVTASDLAEAGVRVRARATGGASITDADLGSGLIPEVVPTVEDGVSAVLRDLEERAVDEAVDDYLTLVAWLQRGADA